MEIRGRRVEWRKGELQNLDKGSKVEQNKVSRIKDKESKVEQNKVSRIKDKESKVEQDKVSRMDRVAKYIWI